MRAFRSSLGALCLLIALSPAAAQIDPVARGLAMQARSAAMAVEGTKAPIANPTFTGVASMPTLFATTATVGSTSVAGTTDLNMRSSGGAYSDVLLRATGGTAGTSYSGTLLMAANTLNLQAKLATYKPVAQLYSGIPGDAGPQSVGSYLDTTNAGGEGYFFRQNCYQTGAVTSGYSLCGAFIANFSGLNGGAGETLWIVSQSPLTVPSGGWGMVNAEFNPIDLGGDTGYQSARGVTSHWVAGVQVVPESSDLLTGRTHGSYNIIAGYVAVHSEGVSAATGYNAQMYNGYLIEADSIAPAGVGFQANGNVDSTRLGTGTLPAFFARAQGKWATGVDTRTATFGSGNAVTVADGQKICLNSADACLYHSGGKLYYDVGGVHMFSVADTTGNVIFKGTVTGSGTP